MYLYTILVDRIYACVYFTAYMIFMDLVTSNICERQLLGDSHRMQWLNGRFWDINASLYIVSSIQRFGLFSTTVTRPRLSPSIPSAKRNLLGRTGQGSMSEAETVNAVARAVTPKSDETNVRLWWFEMRKILDIYCYDYSSNVRAHPLHIRMKLHTGLLPMSKMHRLR